MKKKKRKSAGNMLRMHLFVQWIIEFFFFPSLMMHFMTFSSILVHSKLVVPFQTSKWHLLTCMACSSLLRSGSSRWVHRCNTLLSIWQLRDFKIYILSISISTFMKILNNYRYDRFELTYCQKILKVVLRKFSTTFFNKLHSTWPI